MISPSRVFSNKKFLLFLQSCVSFVQLMRSIAKLSSDINSCWKLMQQNLFITHALVLLLRSDFLMLKNIVNFLFASLLHTVLAFLHSSIAPSNLQYSSMGSFAVLLSILPYIVSFLLLSYISFTWISIFHFSMGRPGHAFQRFVGLCFL